MTLETIQQFKKFLESKIDLSFDFEQEHWENGNADDSYNYGVDVGTQNTYTDCLKEFKTLFNA